jgi:hypothetical protein
MLIGSRVELDEEVRKVGRGGRGPGIAARPKGGPGWGLRFRWGFRRPKRWRKKASSKPREAIRLLEK